MTEDITNVINEAKENKRDITSDEDAKFVVEFEPYHIRSYKLDETLSKKEHDYIEGTINKMIMLYTINSLRESKSYKMLCAISDLNDVRLRRLEHMKLEEEEGKITEEWTRKEEDGTLTPEEDRRFYRRCEYIRSVIEPDYYFGPRISPDEFE